MFQASETGFVVGRNISLTDGLLSLFGRAGIGLLIVAAVSVWLLVARSAFIRGDDMERPTRVGQLYGYSVCLIAVLIGVFTVGSITDKVITLASPGAALQGDYSQPSLTSFEAYRATQDRGRWLGGTPPGGTVAKPDTIPVAELRSRYEALRADRLLHERAEAIRSLVSSAVGLLLAVALFVTHWRWLGQPLARRGREDGVASAA